MQLFKNGKVLPPSSVLAAAGDGGGAEQQVEKEVLGGSGIGKRAWEEHNESNTKARREAGRGGWRWTAKRK